MLGGRTWTDKREKKEKKRTHALSGIEGWLAGFDPSRGTLTETWGSHENTTPAPLRIMVQNTASRMKFKRFDYTSGNNSEVFKQKRRINGAETRLKVISQGPTPALLLVDACVEGSRRKSLKSTTLCAANVEV